MPTAPPHPCNSPGCGLLTAARFCARHEKSERRAVDERRGSASARGYDRKWTNFRNNVYAPSHPAICAKCQHAGISKEMHLDHKTPLAQGGEKYDEANLQWLCQPCHSVKTATEDGGFRGRKA